MALSVGSYVGDGTATRDLVVTAFTPLSTWVWGEDGGGLGVGAFKISGMSDGVSHPWAKNPGTGAASRANRILTLNPDGFTVGADLNVAGRTYQYINWPSQPGVTAAGVYGGNGWSLGGGSTLTTTAGVFSAIGSFRSVDVGQTIRRVSDGALIGVLTGVTNANTATGVISLAGIFAATTWEFVPRQIPLPLVPDLLIVCALSALLEPAGTAVTPVMASPGTGISDSLVRDQNVAGDGRAPATAFVAPGSAVLEVTNADSSGTGGMNGLGITYVWFAIKAAGLTSIPLNKIDYTGTGTSARDITGTTFVPTLFFVIGSVAVFTAFSAYPTWYSSVSALTPGITARVFADGVATLLTGQFTLLPNGVRYANNGFNVLNQTYRAYFLMPGVDPPSEIGFPSAQLLEACSAFSVCPCPSTCD
jgi:hypothetical protein